MSTCAFVRRERGLLQRQLAQRVDVDEVIIVHRERGHTQPGTKSGLAIVQLLGYLPLPTATLAERLYAVRFINGWPLERAAHTIGASEGSWRAWEARQTVKR